MFQEVKEGLHFNSASKNDQKWTRVEFASILDSASTDELFKNLVQSGDITLVSRSEQAEKRSIPLFGVNSLREKGIELICDNLQNELKDILNPLRRTPSCVMFTKQCFIWSRIVSVRKRCYDLKIIKKALEKLSDDNQLSKHKESKSEKAEFKEPNYVLVETGVKGSLELVFSLLRQTWAQLAWQKQLYQFLSSSPTGRGR